MKGEQHDKIREANENINKLIDMLLNERDNSQQQCSINLYPELEMYECELGTTKCNVCRFKARTMFKQMLVDEFCIYTGDGEIGDDLL